MMNIRNKFYMTDSSPTIHENTPHPTPPPRGGRVREGVKKVFFTYSILKNQSGAALVIALVMMVVLTLIGLASIFSSTFEIKISGNKRCSTDAFYAADSGVQVVEARVENFNINNYTSGTYNPFTDNNNINPTNARVTITHDTTQEGAPRGFGFSATNFEFEHFQIASTGQTCPNPVPSTTTIQEKLVRLVPTQQGGY